MHVEQRETSLELGPHNLVLLLSGFLEANSVLQGNSHARGIHIKLVENDIGFLPSFEAVIDIEHAYEFSLQDKCGINSYSSFLLVPR